jgi:hypothetical protein
MDTERSPEPRASGLFGWVSRKPKSAFWSTLLVALFVGLGIGAAAASNTEELEAANDRAAKRGTDLAAVSAERDELRAALADATDRAEAAEERIERLTAKAAVPDFTGARLSEAHDHQLVDELDWRIRTREKVTDAAPAGHVIAQSVSEGKVLKAGRSITLSVAKKPPPKPPEWVTVASFSGSGAKHTDEFTIPRGVKARIAYDFQGDTNAIMSLEDPGGDPLAGDLLLNEIGAYSDVTRVYTPGRWYLDVEGGAWSIQVQLFKRPD